jgi:hypothetical protein
MEWPNKHPRFFGNFRSQAEAEKWIAEHRWLTNWLTEQRTNIVIAGADDLVTNDESVSFEH